MDRVLVFTPTYGGLLQQLTTESIAALTFDGVVDRRVSHDNPHPGRDMRNVVHQFRLGRQMALDGGYDALLLVEHDMIVPPDALQKLWDTPAPVVYGCYELRHGMYALNLFQFTGGRNIGMSLSLYRDELEAARRRGWCEVSGAGFGCLLIRRSVLEAVPFRDAGNAPDLPFAQDCVSARIKQIGRFDVECGHIDTDTGKTLWPWEGNFGMVARVIAMQTMVVRADDASLAIEKDRYYSMSVQSARDLSRAGYVRIMNDADIVADELETAVSPAAEARETATLPTVRKRKPKAKADVS